MGRIPALWLAACLSMAVGARAVGLSPPWMVKFGQYHAAVLGDPCLNLTRMEKVAEAPDRWAFNVTVCGSAHPTKLAAAAVFLTAAWDYGGTVLEARVVDAGRGIVVPPLLPPDLGGHEALAFAAVALTGNRYFVQTRHSGRPPFALYWVEFVPEVVQFWIDNLADFHGNANLIAADLFAEVFRLRLFGLLTTTQALAPGPPAWSGDVRHAGQADAGSNAAQAQLGSRGGRTALRLGLQQELTPGEGSTACAPEQLHKLGQEAVERLLLRGSQAWAQGARQVRHARGQISSLQLPAASAAAEKPVR